MAKDTKKRPDTPLAETPTYNMDASTLADKLKQVQADSNKRMVDSAAARKAKVETRRRTIDRKSFSKSSSLEGLNTKLGGKITTK